MHFITSVTEFTEQDQLSEFLLPMYGFKHCVHRDVLHPFQGGETRGRRRVTGQGSC